MIYENINKVPDTFFDNVPVIIPTFNQLTYCKNTISRLKDFNLNNFIILDNGSTYEPFINWINEIEYPVVVDYRNPGPRDFFVNFDVWNKLPDIFIVTDPDLEYPSSIPQSLVDDMIEITNMYGWSKVALGLSTDPSDEMYAMVKDWERSYWTNVIAHTKYGDPIYDAKTDTTFALYNKKYIKRFGDLSWDGDFFTSPRICGNYLCNHLGWYKEINIPHDEYEFYVNNASAWSSTISATRRR